MWCKLFQLIATGLVLLVFHPKNITIKHGNEERQYIRNIHTRWLSASKDRRYHRAHTQAGWHSKPRATVHHFPVAGVASLPLSLSSNLRQIKALVTSHPPGIAAVCSHALREPHRRPHMLLSNSLTSAAPSRSKRIAIVTLLQ